MIRICFFSEMPEGGKMGALPSLVLKNIPLLISITALATSITPASVNDTNYLPYCTVYSRHTKQPIEKVYADKGYAGQPNRNFLATNNIADGIMRKNSTTAKLTELEINRNKIISKVRYIVEQYFGISHLHDGAKRACFTTIAKNKVDCWYRQAAYNIFKGLKILRIITV